MINFRFSEYGDILLMMPFLIVGLGIILYSISFVLFKLIKD